LLLQINFFQEILKKYFNPLQSIFFDFFTIVYVDYAIAYLFIY